MTATTPTERPILFSGEMVRATLAGRKTQTRRALKPQPVRKGRFWRWDENFSWDDNSLLHGGVSLEPLCPYGVRGERLWVKENHRLLDCTCPETCRLPGKVWFAATETGYENAKYCRLRPSIFMPRWASRLTLEIVRVRVERLQEIEVSPEDALAEGIHAIIHGRSGTYFHAFNTDYSSQNWSSPERAYQELWESINGKRSWEKNPWVWVIEFKRVEDRK